MGLRTLKSPTHLTLNSLLQSSPEVAILGEAKQQGLKPALIELTLSARLKPCPCYKARFKRVS